MLLGVSIESIIAYKFLFRKGIGGQILLLFDLILSLYKYFFQSKLFLIFYLAKQ
jgi:hypothetical protein